MISKKQLGMTQWNLPRPRENAVEIAAGLGLHCVHLELGDREKGYPMAQPERQQTVLKDAERYGIALPSLALNGLCRTGFAHPVDGDARRAAEDMLALGVETAARMGIPSVSIPSFGDNAMDCEDDYLRTAEGLRHVCRLARRQGVDVYTENVLEPRQLQRLWRDVDEPNLRLLFDTQNYAFCGHNCAAEVFTAWRAHLGGFLHLKDGANAMGNCALGRGTAGFAAVWERVREDGFPGWLILENSYSTRQALQNEIDGFETNWCE